MSDCPFCLDDGTRLVDGRYWYVRPDKFPVVENHLLVITKRHVAHAERLTAKEWAELGRLITGMVGGSDFNVGINRGDAAGQTIPHVHVHVFPRVAGDVDNPRGGIRNFKKPLVAY